MPALFAALALAVAMGAYAAHAFTRHRFLASKEDELRAIADLKVAQIVAWRAERLADARVAAADPLLVAAVRNWLADAPRGDLGAALQARLDSLRDEYGYERMTLLDADGALRLTAPKSALGHVESDELARQARESAGVSFIDLHRPDAGTGIHLELVAPLLLPGDGHSRPVAFLEFLIDPQRFLYPLLQSWPTPSQSGETLLVRREGDFVVFLNELRHRKGQALSLRLPISQSDLPAAQAVQGKEGIVEGRDYRGEPVLAALRRVPNSLWFLTAKVDYDEVVAPLARDAWLTTLLALALIGLAGLAAQRFRSREQALSDAELLESKALRRLQGAALEAAANAVMITDREGRIVWVNDAFYSLTGWSLDECRGRTPRMFKSGRHDLAFYQELWRRILRGDVWQHEMINRRKGGELYVEDQTITPVANERGEITHFIAIKIDTTERQRAEKALQDAEIRYRVLFEQSPFGVLLIDPETGKTLDANEVAHKQLGYTREEFAALRISDYEVLEKPEETRRRMQKVLAEGSDDFETVHRTKNGEIRNVHVWTKTLQLGERTAFYGIFEDVTERRRAEEAILKEKTLSEAIVDSLPGIFYLFDHTGRFLRWNRSFETVSGYSAEEIAAMRPLDLFIGEDRTLIEERIGKVFEAGAAEAEAALASKDGRRIPHHFVAARTVVDGVPCCIGTGFDVTAQKHLEAQLRHSDKLQGIGRLAGGVAHDFNNILGVITGYGELAQRQLGPDHPVRARIDQVLKAAQRAAGLTRQLLAFSRKQTMEPKVLDLNVVIADAEKMLGRLIGEDVDLVVRAAPGLGMVKADPSQIEQVVMNLAVNARDAMPEGGTLTFETGNVELDEAYAAAHPPAPLGRYVLLTVSDTGGGMDKETQAHIFEPFFTTKPVGQGTGLGLAMVYGIVKQSDGYIWLYSELGRGTTFKIYLPRVDEEAEAAQAAAPSAAAPGGHERILLVEDTVTLREVVRETLEERGYTVVLASNGEEALALAREPEPIHLLLTDVIMPKLGGGELARQVAALRPGIRVLYMSGYTADAISRQGLLGEGIVLLQKPFTGDKLARAVREALDRPAPRG